MASEAPGTRLAAARTSPGRINVLEGMHPKNEHSPPTSRSSTIATDRPPSAHRPAAFSPGGPAPITITSNSSPMVNSLPQDLEDRPVPRSKRYEAPRMADASAGGAGFIS